MTPTALFRSSTLLLALLAVGAASPRPAAAQAAPQAPAATVPPPATPTQRAAPAPPPPRRQGTAAAKPYAMAVRFEDGFINVALRAREARVADIAKDLATQLRARIDVGPGLAREVVTVDLPSSPLEAVLQAIAPRVFVDYEVRQDARPLPLAILLLSPTDPEPKANVVQRGASQGLVISGHTEETPTDDGKDPVAVSGDRHQLSIAARNQPLALVAMVVADTLGVTLDMDYPAGELVLVNVTNLPAEDAVMSISPNIRLHVRVDLSRAERTPLKLRVTRPGAQAAR
jgi:hypothetical protein